MSITAVRPYFRARLNALSYVEWTDGFNVENIPSSLLDLSYHLEIGSMTSSSASHTVHVINYPITVRVFLKGFRDPSAKIDNAVSRAEALLTEILDKDNRLGTTIKDVIPDSIDVLPLDESNDNHIILEMNFTAVVNCYFS